MYVVTCYCDSGSNLIAMMAGHDPTIVLASSQLFDTRAEADDYATTVNQSRMPTVYKLEAVGGRDLDTEVRRLRRQLDNVKVRAYELGCKELHDMALKSLKGAE